MVMRLVQAYTQVNLVSGFGTGILGGKKTLRSTADRFLWHHISR